MIKIKKNGFTLPEVLITLAIVGSLAALVLPGLIKDTQTRAMIALLQGTVVHLNDAVQTEFSRSGAKNIKDTLMWTDQKAFFAKSFDVAVNCEAKTNTPCLGSAYKNINAGSYSIGYKTPTLLKNGVSIDMVPGSDNNANDNILVIIDLNGGKDPNIVGVDVFHIWIMGKSDPDKGVRLGDVRGSLKDPDPDDPDGVEASSVTNSQLQTSCKSGDPSACYLLLERSGFDPKYLDNTY